MIQKTCKHCRLKEYIESLSYSYDPTSEWKEEVKEKENSLNSFLPKQTATINPSANYNLNNIKE